MKVHLVKSITINEYVREHANSRNGFVTWLRILNSANWTNTNDILKSFTNADILGNSTQRIVFDIGGNKFRCICNYSFGEQYVHLFVKWIGTHAEYSKLCDTNNQYTISIY